MEHKFRIGDVVRNRESNQEHLITGVSEKEQAYCVDEDNPMCDVFFPFSWEDRYELIKHVSVEKRGVIYK